MSDEAPSTSAAPSAGALLPWRRRIEWFWCGAALSQAKAALRACPPLMVRARALARASAELADRAYDPIEPLRSGSSLPFSLSLYREAAFWVLVAQEPQEPPWRTLADALDGADPDVIRYGAGDTEEGVAAVRRALQERSFVDTAFLPSAELALDALAARSFVHALLGKEEQAERQVARLWRQRWSRTLTAGIVVLLVIAVSLWGLRQRHRAPDLAAGRPWRTSSVYRGFSPQSRVVDGNATSLAFHTDEEESPWWEVDLETDRPIREVDVTNRGDGFGDRAIPLVIELSRDHTEWSEVGRRTTTFAQWDQNVGGQLARYVRLRALKRTWLHLEGVAVR